MRAAALAQVLRCAVHWRTAHREYQGFCDLPPLRYGLPTTLISASFHLASARITFLQSPPPARCLSNPNVILAHLPSSEVSPSIPMLFRCRPLPVECPCGSSHRTATVSFAVGWEEHTCPPANRMLPPPFRRCMPRSESACFLSSIVDTGCVLIASNSARARRCSSAM